MIRAVLCAACRGRVHESESITVRGPRGREQLCRTCSLECEEPTLPNAAQVLHQLREGTGVGL
jgi:hypothetical protein